MPERMCIVTRVVKDEAALVRFARSPEGQVVPDLKRKLPGRGVWVSLDAKSVAEAARRGLFAKGFGAAATADGNLAARVGHLLRQEAVSSLSLARKAGEALCGFMKVEEALKRGPVRVLLHSPESAADGRSKLDRLAQGQTVVSQALRPSDLDLAFGRTNVVHAAEAAGGLAEKLVLQLQRLAAYEGLEHAERIGLAD